VWEKWLISQTDLDTWIGWHENVFEQGMLDAETQKNEAIAQSKLLGEVTRAAIIRISLCDPKDIEGLNRIKDIAT